jgi:acyl-coenzyme A synthetase/AMP-(fatty) acid ligase
VPAVLEVPAYYNFAVDVIERWARQRPDALGLWCVDATSRAEQKFTFQQLAEHSLKTANFLHSKGLKRGAPVLVMLPRVPQWWLAMLGMVRAGAVPVPCTPLLTDRDLAYRIQAARVEAVIADMDGVAKLDSFDGLRFVVGGDCPGWINLDSGVLASPAQFDGEPTRSDDPGIIYFTSATTGEPKMVLHTQASYGLAHRLTGQLWLDLQPDDVHWNLSDVGWGKAAWSSFYGPWNMGACVFGVNTHGRFDPVATLRTLSEYPITTWCAPPTALRFIVREDLSHWQFPRLRHCVSAGEPVNAEVISAWKAATGLTIYEAYGQTETVVLIGNYRSLGHPVRPGSMGKPTPGFEVALLDDEMQELPAGQEGEIAVRIAPIRPVGLFREYWNNPLENSRQFRGDWYLTGDRAVRDSDGYYWFVGRRDDVIKSSGYRIGPCEVENALLEHAAVLDVAVVGKPDPVRGQIVKAFVMLRNSLPTSDALKRELQRHCKKIVAPYKYPREIEFVSELPKTTSGKTRRFELRQRG